MGNEALSTPLASRPTPSQTCPDVTEDDFVKALARVFCYLWDSKKVAACEMGTKMHRILEWCMNGNLLWDLWELDPALRKHHGECTLPKEQFYRFHEDVMLKEGLVPYCAEWSVYSRQWRLAGQIDCVMV